MSGHLIRIRDCGSDIETAFLVPLTQSPDLRLPAFETHGMGPPGCERLRDGGRTHVQNEVGVDWRRQGHSTFNKITSPLLCSLMTFLLNGSEGLDRIKCMEMALVHDLAESLVGDITPYCGVSKKDKEILEMEAIHKICGLIEPRGEHILQLFYVS